MVSNCDKRSYGQKLWRWLRYKITKNIIRFDKNVDAFIVVSSFLKKFVGENLMTDKPVRQIYNPLFIDKSVNSTIREENLIETIKKNNLLKFLYVGRLSPEKGLELLLDSIIQIKAELIIVGDGELMDKCLAASKKAEGRIKVLGYQDRQFVFKIMKACDCLVLPSKCIEPAPLVLAEAGYNKLPCIVTGHGGLAEFIQPGVNGFYFEPDNLSSLKKVMEEIVKNPGILEPMKEKSREIIDNMKLHTNDYIEQITKLYYEILQ